MKRPAAPLRLLSVPLLALPALLTTGCGAKPLAASPLPPAAVVPATALLAAAKPIDSKSSRAWKATHSTAALDSAAGGNAP